MWIKCNHCTDVQRISPKIMCMHIYKKTKTTKLCPIHSEWQSDLISIYKSKREVSIVFKQVIIFDNVLICMRDHFHLRMNTQPLFLCFQHQDIYNWFKMNYVCIHSKWQTCHSTIVYFWNPVQITCINYCWYNMIHLIVKDFKKYLNDWHCPKL